MSDKGHIRIEHEGRVAAIGEDFIRVEIVDKSACAACHAKGMCTAAEEKIKIVDVPLTIGTMTRSYTPGEKVILVLSSSLGAKAVFLAYAVPLLVLLVAMLTASFFEVGELMVGLCGIGAVALYYLVLSFFRHRLSRVFLFSIEKTNL